MKTWLLRTALALFSCSVMFAQAAPGSLSFEVASIKPSAPQPMGMIRIGVTADAGMARYNNVSLRDLIRSAYRVKDFQIEGPDWLNSTRYDIVAKLPEGAKQDQIPEMMQSLLAERFKLTLHRDTKDHPIYALVVGKNGAQLKPAEVQAGDAVVPGETPKPAPTPGGGAAGAAADATATARTGGPGGTGPGGPPRAGMMMMMSPEGIHLKVGSATVAAMADGISRFTERPVVDMTGIKGQYDFDMTFAPEKMPALPRPPMPPPPGADRPANAETPGEQAQSVFDAVQKYGLKLEPRKAPLEVLTIDHIEKTPTEN